MSRPAGRAITFSATNSRGPGNRWAVLALLGVAQLMIVLDVTIVNIALPSAQHALHFSTDDGQWIITAYALTFGSLLLLGGKLGDLFGRKWTFVAGLLGFAIASALGGLAPSFDANRMLRNPDLSPPPHSPVTVRRRLPGPCW